ncbi:MAG: DUF4126 domain-containing protein [Myxococcaceae bacterium]|nr:MAG: DUF4126 domain-containing protein [Myxococcaceae bacterium]
MDGSGTLISSLLTGLGLAGAAGLNAYIPLLGVALLGRMHVLTLSAPFDVLMHPVTIAALVVLLALEVVVDKVPAADHVNDVVQTFVRPAAGALLFLGGSGAAGQVPPLVLLLAGLVTAFGVHATKAAVRPAVNVSTLGVATPLVSLLEDLLSAITTVVAVLVPILVLLLLGGLLWVGLRFARRRRAGA